MPTRTLVQLVEEIKALSPKERKDRTREVARARRRLHERGRQKGNLRRIPRN